MYNSFNHGVYTYCYQNPIKLIDPNGKQTEASKMRRTVSGAFLGWLVPPARPNTALQYMQRDRVHAKFAQASLDALGLIPIVGEPVDMLNGALYAVQEKGTDAMLSFAGAIPFVGWGATAAKWSRNVLKFSNGAFHSRSGLRFLHGSIHGNRLSHVIDHTVNNLSKAKHGVFTVGDDLVGTIDDAWVLAKKGGNRGSGEDLHKVQIVVRENTSDVITAYPTK